MSMRCDFGSWCTRGFNQTSELPQVGFAFHRIEKALSLLVANLSDLSGLAAKTERIDALFACAHPAHISPRPALAAYK